MCKYVLLSFFLLVFTFSGCEIFKITYEHQFIETDKEDELSGEWFGNGAKIIPDSTLYFMQIDVWAKENFTIRRTISLTDTLGSKGLKLTADRPIKLTIKCNWQGARVQDKMFTNIGEDWEYLINFVQNENGSFDTALNIEPGREYNIKFGVK